MRNRAVGRDALGTGTFHSLAAAWINIFACGSAGFAHIFMRLADTAAAAGGKIAPRALARDTLTGSRVFVVDFRPIALKLFGNELSKTGERALPHFRAARCG